MTVTEPAPLPATTATIVAQLDQAINDAVDARRVGDTVNGSAPAEGMTPQPRPLPELNVAVDRLAGYAGDAIAAPLRAPVLDAVHLVEHLTARAQRSEAAYQYLADRAIVFANRADTAESFLPAAREELVRVGLAYGAAVVDRVHLEELARELEAIIVDEGKASGRRLTPATAAARLREARKRATKAAGERLTNLDALDVDAFTDAD